MRLRLYASGLSLAVAACAGGPRAEPAASVTARRPPCLPDNGGISLPRGFCATIVADSLPRPRHLVVAPNGDVFVSLLGSGQGGLAGGFVGLRDTNGDGRADVQERFGDAPSSEVALYRGYLYVGAPTSVLRYPLRAGEVRPSGPPDTIVVDLPTGGHAFRTFAIDSSGALLLNVGSLSNSCQERNRQRESRGVDPCVELETRAGIWRFRTDRRRQTQRDGEHFATGIRNAVAIAINPADRALYVAQHGRDQLYANWPALFDSVKSAETPAEELFRVERGDDFGWPYCYYDAQLGRKVLAPEYGGDGRATGRCDGKKGNIAAHPAHWAPNALLFYTGSMFPARYREGAFIAYHGSWNRQPGLPQSGFNVVFQPLRSGRAAGDFEVFADNFFAEEARLAARANQAPPGLKRHRPTGLAMGPDGSLYISDDSMGRIWRVFYVGERSN
jgi:glucose/arabinose dehydrogenase